MGKKQLNKKSHFQKKDKAFCIVCLNKKPNITLNCRHQFCIKCIQKWLKISKSCPLCRSTIKSFKTQIQDKNDHKKVKFNHSLYQSPTVRTLQNHLIGHKQYQQTSAILPNDRLINLTTLNGLQIVLQTI